VKETEAMLARLAVATLAVAITAAGPVTAGSDSGKAPTIETLLALETISSARISPDGRWVVFGRTRADFDADAYVTDLWLASTGGGEPFQLTRGPKSASSPQWSPDGRWLSFTAARDTDESQIFLIRPDGGEAVRLTDVKTGVGRYAWSPDSRRIAFAAPERPSKAREARDAYLGKFDVVRRDYTHNHLWIVDVAEVLSSPAQGTRVTEGTDFSVGSFSWSPDGTRLAFDAALNPDLVSIGTIDLYVVDIEAGSVNRLVSQQGPDGNPEWSPDGTEIVFETAMGRPDFFHANPGLAIVSADGGTPRAIAADFDEEPSLIAWTATGIHFQGLEKTAGHLFLADPATGAYRRVSWPDALIAGSFTVTSDGSQTAFVSASPTSMWDVYVSPTERFAPRRLTDSTAQLSGLAIGERRVISWKSEDGTAIEGVLVTPPDFEDGTRRPLLVEIHGGPTGIDRPVLLDTRYYPTDVWVARGALVLKVNYRGSAGYGEAFRQLNVRNLGVGDAWDVLSGIETLVSRGWVDPTRVGCMGWSQGGYISAFLTTSTTACRAVSVGAGISNWATYYYNTDITQFTLQYLGDDPIDDPAIYEKTSPMSYIRQARTPTLIQHGENDRRVPIPNAYELRQGLEDRGVPVEMIVYKGFGHGITKPKAMRAVMRHNLEWFGHYLWDDPVPAFVAPDVPEDEKQEDASAPTP
jgi:dipeptidyl aminopeptidase/acylaminoacyl peptidase